MSTGSTVATIRCAVNIARNAMKAAMPLLGPASRRLRWLLEVPLCRPGAWVSLEESDHLARSIGPPGIGVGATVASTRPCVAGPVDTPLLQDAPPAGVLVHFAGIGVAIGHLSVLDGHLQTCRAVDRRPLRDHLVTVARVNLGIVISVEHDRRDDPRAWNRLEIVAVLSAAWHSGALAHRGERGRKVMGCRVG